MSKKSKPDGEGPRWVLMVPCKECHTPLVSPDSVARGVGPVCGRKHKPPEGMDPLFPMEVK